MKKILMIVVPLLLIGGGVVGAAMMGMIQIPGLTPIKKKAAAAAGYAETTEETPMVRKEATPSPAEPLEKPPELDMDKGRKKLAKLWNELEAAQIVDIAEDWKDDEFARQIKFLDGAKASEVLAELKPERASKISKLLQQIHAEPMKLPGAVS